MGNSMYNWQHHIFWQLLEASGQKPTVFSFEQTLQFNTETSLMNYVQTQTVMFYYKQCL